MYLTSHHLLLQCICPLIILYCPGTVNLSVRGCGLDVVRNTSVSSMLVCHLQSLDNGPLSFTARHPSPQNDTHFHYKHTPLLQDTYIHNRPYTSTTDTHHLHWTPTSTSNTNLHNRPSAPVPLNTSRRPARCQNSYQLRA